MRLRGVHVVASVRRKQNRMVKRRVGKAPITGAIQPHPVKLHFFGIITTASQVVEKSGVFIYAHDSFHFEAVIGQGCQELSGEVVESVVLPAGLLRGSQEALTV